MAKTILNTATFGLAGLVGSLIGGKKKPAATTAASTASTTNQQRKPIITQLGAGPNPGFPGLPGIARPNLPTLLSDKLGS